MQLFPAFRQEPHCKGVRLVFLDALQGLALQRNLGLSGSQLLDDLQSVATRWIVKRRFNACTVRRLFQHTQRHHISGLGNARIEDEYPSREFEVSCARGVGAAIQNAHHRKQKQHWYKFPHKLIKVIAVQFGKSETVYMSYLFQILVNGLHNGFLYGLLAYGYVLLNQVVQRPNLAHGAFFAFSGQILVLGATLGYNALIFTFASSIAFGLGASALLSGIVLSVFAFIIVPRFRDQSPNMMIVATLALAIILMEAVRIGASGRDFWLPPLSDVQVRLGFGASITLVQAVNMVLILLLLVAADVVLSMTGAGRAVRAVAQDEKAASLCGINTRRVVVSTATASGIMSCIGGILALLHFGNMSFGAGLTYGLKVLFIAAAGGFTTPRMAAIAAFGFGEAEALWDGYLPIIWREAFFYAGLSVMLVIRGNARNLS